MVVEFCGSTVLSLYLPSFTGIGVVPGLVLLIYACQYTMAMILSFFLAPHNWLRRPPLRYLGFNSIEPWSKALQVHACCLWCKHHVKTLYPQMSCWLRLHGVVVLDCTVLVQKCLLSGPIPPNLSSAHHLTHDWAGLIMTYNLGRGWNLSPKGGNLPSLLLEFT